MKLLNKSDESWAQGINYGIVLLGPAAGKLKYTLLDKQDIELIQEYQFEAFVEIDKNGEGACVYAFVYDANKGRKSGRCLHNVLWERHFGGVAPQYKVIHKNGITVDNRLENLALHPISNKYTNTVNDNNIEDSIYWSAVVRMPHEIVPAQVKLFGSQEEALLMDDERYFECHYPPCTNIEKRPLEFSICGLCHVTRYCGPTCQTRDWPFHKPTCSQKLRPVRLQRFPDR
ncbi:zinc finger MYND domain-containing protein 19-like [Uloborus diversus]|uniref:zinc finger MYND domain-containing protein 19-like n=1 Tax=Uloborus diversus TaxID=327109 RepID=UPI002409CEB8|nr:zinc finger MYND domain-containing protein 19-like [Uloborus diversus]